MGDGAVRTSEVLTSGQLYSRNDLRERFNIVDQTLNTGIFKPHDHESIWLFVTEKKAGGMTAYEDLLDGDILYWQGQTAGLKDPLIIEHAGRGLELVLFYRERKDAYPEYEFRFEGPFEYSSHSGSRPTSFVLHRAGYATAVYAPIVTDQPVPANDASLDSAATTNGPCLVTVLAGLRQSGRDAIVTEGHPTDAQQAMHVPDKIEDWVAERIEAWRAAGAERPFLVVLSGNAGDGKSDLIERLRVRPEVAGDDLEVIADATHSESPSQSQAKRLTEALSPFSSEPLPGAKPQCVLVAMNVGMVIAFFSELEGTPDAARFGALRTVLESRLGLSDLDPQPPTPARWEAEVINLDHRNLLGHKNDGLLAGMLDKLDPREEGSMTAEASKECVGCPVRASCWVPTNLNILTLKAARDGLHDLLWEVTLGSDIHLTPRNVWDLLFHITTGGLELPSDGDTGAFLSCDWLRANLPPTAKQFSGKQLRLAQRRLVYNLLFEEAGPETSARGPLLSAFRDVDPIRRGGKQTHFAEGEVRASAAADSENLSDLALAAGEPGTSEPDPMLVALASLTDDPKPWEEPDKQNLDDLALGVSRRARLTGLPSAVKDEVSDHDARRFLDLLKVYARWDQDSEVPSEVKKFWGSEFVGGVAAMFGTSVGEEMHFRLDTLSPATRYASYVEVDLKKHLKIDPDDVSATDTGWLQAVSYLPRKLTGTVDAGGQVPWVIPVDLKLFRLLSQVSRGYAASSVDLDAFFRLRYACERLGVTHPEDPILFKSVRDGRMFKLSKERVLGGTETTFSEVKQ